ncbi:recombinase RecT [Acidiphilium angustum]|uniref:recombinase RecT n=1 Tax=Acidiphilium angustum TaxID=523 RepID=UPI00049421FC|nr:recombinase RecT [Acidiphilium angustum]
MNAVTPPPQPPSRGSLKRLRDCTTLGEAFETTELRQIIAQGVPEHVTADRMLRSFVQAVNKQPDLRYCDWHQVIGACLSLSHIGLEPNTPLNHAYLIPFKSKVWNPETRKRDKEIYDLNVVIGFGGYADLLWRSGIVTNIHADVVLPGDEFDLVYGTDAHLTHKPAGKAKRTDEPIWAYAHVTMALTNGSGQAFDAMPWNDVLDIRERSQAYRSALAQKETAEQKGWGVPRGYTDSPWIRDMREMGKKTAFRRLQKYLRKSAELSYAVDLEDRQDYAGSLDFSKVIDGNPNDINDAAPENRPEIEHKVYVDPLAAHSMRQADPVQTQTQGQPATTAPKAQPVQTTAAPAAQAVQPAAASEEWLLYDASGDVAEICPDAEIWLAQFIDLYRRTPADMMLALQEFNDATIHTVAALGGSYVQVLADNGIIAPAPDQARDVGQSALTDQSASSAPEQNQGLWMPPQLPPLPLDRNQRPDQKKIGSLMETALGMCTSGDQIETFLGAMKPDWCSLENGARLVVMRAIATRKMQLGIPPAKE